MNINFVGLGNEWPMSEIDQIIDTLENRVRQLADKTVRLEQTVSDLRRGLDESEAARQQQLEEIDALKSANETLKMANSLLGSDDNKRETKLKINSLIREIDYCISQLAD